MKQRNSKSILDLPEIPTWGRIPVWIWFALYAAIIGGFALFVVLPDFIPVWGIA